MKLSLGQNFNSFKQLYQYRVSDRRSQILYVVTYASTGEVLNREEQSQNWTPIIPGSVDEAQFKFALQYAPRR